MKIVQLRETQANTKRGLVDKWLVTLDDGRKFDTFVDDWNADWKEGDEIDLSPDQFQEREWNGKKYLGVRAPRGGYNRPAPQVANTPTQVKVDNQEVLAALRKVYGSIEENHSEVMAALEVIRSERMTPEEKEIAISKALEDKEIRLEDVPF